MKEKRQNLRFGPLVIKVELNLGEARREGYLTNVSSGGAFLAIDEPPPIGTELQLRALLPWRLGELKASATVVWRNVAIENTETQDSGHQEMANAITGAGLAFTKLTPHAETALQAYLDRFTELAAQIEGS